jgi:hypothetical protein
VYERAKDVVAALKERWDVDVTPQAVGHYDPTTVAGARELAAEWRELFHTTRTRYNEELADVAIAQKGWRLRQLQRLYERTADKPVPNVVLAAALLEQAAKEAGGAFTNRRELTGANGEPLPVGAVPLTDAEKEARADGILARALQRRAEAAAAGRN